MAYLDNKRKAPKPLYTNPQLSVFPRAATLLPQQQISPGQHSLYYSPTSSQQPRHSSTNIRATPTNMLVNAPAQSVSPTAQFSSLSQYHMSG